MAAQISACVSPCIASRCKRSSPAGVSHLLILDLRANRSTSEIKTARTGLLWAMREEVARVRAVLAKMHRERKGVGKTPPAG